jgi:hypothetical protein
MVVKDRPGREIPGFVFDDIAAILEKGVVYPLPISLERRWSIRTFKYGYLVTT